MADIQSVPDPTYITIALVKAQTKIDGLTTLADGDLTTLIQTAEEMIDAYVGPQRHHIYDTNIYRVFPREQDFQRTNLVEWPTLPIIPLNVTRACLRQVEWLFTQWWPNKATDEIPVDYDVTGIDMGGDGSVSETRVRKGLDFSSATMSVQARHLLKDYHSKAAGIAVSKPRWPLSTGALSSREGTYMPNLPGTGQ